MPQSNTPKLEANESPFNSTAEVVIAISDPRYTTDADYQASVRRRLDACDVLAEAAGQDG